MDLLHHRRAMQVGDNHLARTLVRLIAVLVMAALTLFSWWLAVGAATGCAVRCDAEPQVWLGLILAGSVGATAASTAWLAGWALGRETTWRSRAVVIAAAAGVALAVTSILSLRIG